MTETEGNRGGFFITFEGTEGSGKTTQIALLRETLERSGRAVVVTREPGGTRFGNALRGILLGLDYPELSPESELFLYQADRAQHMSEIILPALTAGRIVLCDRFTDATLAYQGFGRNIDRDLIAGLNATATGGRSPDLTILLDFSNVEEGLRRASARDSRSGAAGVEDRFERETVDFHRKVQRGYRSLAGAEQERFRIFSAADGIEELQGKSP